MIIFRKRGWTFYRRFPAAGPPCTTDLRWVWAVCFDDAGPEEYSFMCHEFMYLCSTLMTPPVQPESSQNPPKRPLDNLAAESLLGQTSSDPKAAATVHIAQSVCIYVPAVWGVFYIYFICWSNFGRSRNGSRSSGDLVPDPWGSIPGPGRGVRGGSRGVKGKPYFTCSCV